MKKLESSEHTLATVKKNLESVEVMVRSIRGLAFYAFAGVEKDSKAGKDLEALVTQCSCLLAYIDGGAIMRPPKFGIELRSKDSTEQAMETSQ